MTCGALALASPSSATWPAVADRDVGDPSDEAAARLTEPVDRKDLWTWQAGFFSPAGDTPEAAITSAIVDGSDNLILAGSANGPLQLSSHRTLPASSGEQAFIAKVTPSGRVEWVRTLGLWPRGPRLQGHGVMAMEVAGDVMVAIGDFEPGMNSTSSSKDRRSGLRIALVDRAGELKRDKAVALGGDVIALAALSTKDLIAVGCRREWSSGSAPGVPRRLQQSGSFVDRLSIDGKVIWSTAIRQEGSALPPVAPQLGPPLDCATGVTVTPDGRIFIVGLFEGSFRIGADALDADRGTFLAEFGAGGEPLWARSVAKRLVTTAYDERPMVTLLGAHLVTAGVVPYRGRPDGLWGIAAFDLHGSLVWSRSIQSTRGCCSNEFLVLATTARNIVLAGRGDSTPVLIDGVPAGKVTSSLASSAAKASSAPFFFRLPEVGRPTLARQLPGFGCVPTAIRAGRTGSWVVGTQTAVGQGRGLFAHWIRTR